MWHRRYPGNREPVCCDARCRIHYTYASDGTHYTYEDNLFSLPSRYLKLIKRCDIHVQMPAVPSRREAQFYSNIRTRLGDFAARFGGLDHSLQEVVVQFNQPRTDVVPAQADVKVQEAWARQVESLWREGVSIDRGCLTQRSTFVCALNGRAENALEPLGTVYGARTVKVVGASKEMKAKLEKAMTSRNLACVSKEEKYGTRRARIIKRRRKKESQRYRLGKFYETKFDWAV